MNFGLIAEIILSLTIATMKTVNEANIDDTDEYLKVSEIITQVKINKNANDNDVANNIPKYVATPFPPLNFNQIGNTCPKKVQRDVMYINSEK